VILEFALGVEIGTGDINSILTFDATVNFGRFETVLEVRTAVVPTRGVY